MPSPPLAQDAPPAATPVFGIVVMGVSGSGKSSLAQALADALSVPMIEGDDFHPPENKARMQAGVALTDADRAGWLAALGAELQRLEHRAVLSCSALKLAYRDRLRAASPGLRFVFIEIDQATAFERTQARRGGNGPGHFFNPQLVANQFETLESPVGEPGVFAVSAMLPLDDACERALAWLRAAAPTSAT